MGMAAQLDARFWDRAWRILVASLMMGGVLWIAESLLSAALHQEGWRYLALAGLVVAGGAAYAIAGQLIGAFTLGELRRSLRRSG